MPVTVSYPGVYIEELPSAVRTITGVATSVTAFVGRAVRGPVDTPVLIHSFGEYNRIFGGLWKPSSMSYAVYLYFLNGGADAVIVRVHNKALPSSFKSEGRSLSEKIVAANPGKWPEDLKLEVEAAGALDDDTPNGVPAELNPENNKLFNLFVRDTRNSPSITLESHYNLSLIRDHPRRADKILTAESEYIRFGTVANWDDLDYDAVKGKYTPSGGSDGDALTENEILGKEKQGEAFVQVDKKGIYALEDADIFNLLCIPPFAGDESAAAKVFTNALELCKNERAIFLVDPPEAWNKPASAKIASPITPDGNAAIYFPRIKIQDPLEQGRLTSFAPSAAIAGVIARTDANRGVWKSPAGIEATVAGAVDLDYKLTDKENGELNPKGINCLRNKTDAGIVVWGARTLRGADTLADQWKYLAVRRTALYIEETLYRGTQWVVFEPNDEPLWSQIRLNIGAFMHDLFRKGAFQGTTPKEAYFVKCDKETTTQYDIDRGIVNILVGFAPLKPAEFVIIKIQQLAGQQEA